jgi:hypothetical protein
LFENHGISAVSGRNGVEIFATLPETDGLLSQINEWYLAHHVEFSS